MQRLEYAVGPESGHGPTSLKLVCRSPGRVFDGPGNVHRVSRRRPARRNLKGQLLCGKPERRDSAVNFNGTTCNPSAGASPAATARIRGKGRRLMRTKKAPGKGRLFRSLDPDGFAEKSIAFTSRRDRRGSGIPCSGGRALHGRALQAHACRSSFQPVPSAELGRGQ